MQKSLVATAIIDFNTLYFSEYISVSISEGYDPRPDSTQGASVRRLDHLLRKQGPA